MYLEFFDLRSEEGVCFEIKSIHMVGPEIRLEGPDSEWYRLMPAGKDDPRGEWKMWHRSWIDLAVVEGELAHKVITWEQAAMWLLPD